MERILQDYVVQQRGEKEFFEDLIKLFGDNTQLSIINKYNLNNLPQDIIRRFVLPGSIIHTDCWAAYNMISEVGQNFTHYSVRNGMGKSPNTALPFSPSLRIFSVPQEDFAAAFERSVPLLLLKMKRTVQVLPQAMILFWRKMMSWRKIGLRTLNVSSQT